MILPASIIQQGQEDQPSILRLNGKFEANHNYFVSIYGNYKIPYLLISLTLLDDILEIEEPSPVENNSSKADNEEKFEGTSPAVDCSILMAEDRYKDN